MTALIAKPRADAKERGLQYYFRLTAATNFFGDECPVQTFVAPDLDDRLMSEVCADATNVFMTVWSKIYWAMVEGKREQMPWLVNPANGKTHGLSWRISVEVETSDKPTTNLTTTYKHREWRTKQ